MRVAITGGTGTLGHALTAHLLRDPQVERIVILSRDEVKQAMMALEYGLEPRLRFFLGDIRDESRITDAFYGCDTVVHAAALKRVDAVAYNPSEVRKTNIEGSAKVINAALKAGVTRVLMISSDKACHPTNIYGVTKAAMEWEAVASNAITYPRGMMVSCTRYGNVLGSRGSVLHTWRQAVREGKPIPLTHPDMTRFWMTPADAASFVCLSLQLMEGGEIFVPMMKAMRLIDLAEALAPGHPIDITGLRPGGEKIHEIVVTDEESVRSIANNATKHAFLVITPHLHPWIESFFWRANIGMLKGEVGSNAVGHLSANQMRTMLETV